MRLAPLLLAIVMATPVSAQHVHSSTGHSMGGPQETGQSAFAALAEIVPNLLQGGISAVIAFGIWKILARSSKG